jgi:hypothetical protein
MLCLAVSIIPKLLHVVLDVRDVDCWVKTRCLCRRRLLCGRVVGREDGLLGLLADVHLEVARDSLLLGHCGGCVWRFVGRKGGVGKWVSRKTCSQRRERVVLVVLAGSRSRRRIKSQLSGGRSSLERLRGWKNAVAGSGIPETDENAQEEDYWWDCLDSLPMGGQMTSACCRARLDDWKLERNRCRMQKERRVTKDAE